MYALSHLKKAITAARDQVATDINRRRANENILLEQEHSDDNQQREEEKGEDDHKPKQDTGRDQEPLSRRVAVGWGAVETMAKRGEAGKEREELAQPEEDNSSTEKASVAQTTRAATRSQLLSAVGQRRSHSAPPVVAEFEDSGSESLGDNDHINGNDNGDGNNNRNSNGNSNNRGHGSNAAGNDDNEKSVKTVWYEHGVVSAMEIEVGESLWDAGGVLTTGGSGNSRQNESTGPSPAGDNEENDTASATETYQEHQFQTLQQPKQPEYLPFFGRQDTRIESFVSNEDVIAYIDEDDGSMSDDSMVSEGPYDAAFPSKPAPKAGGQPLIKHSSYAAATPAKAAGVVDGTVTRPTRSPSLISTSTSSRLSRRSRHHTHLDPRDHLDHNQGDDTIRDIVVMGKRNGSRIPPTSANTDAVALPASSLETPVPRPPSLSSQPKLPRGAAAHEAIIIQVPVPRRAVGSQGDYVTSATATLVQRVIPPTRRVDDRAVLNVLFEM